MPKREAKYVQLHDVFFIPGAGQIDKSLPPQNKTLKGLKMTYVEETGCIILTWEGAAFDHVLPAASIKAVSLVKEQEPKVEAPKAPAVKKPEPAKAS